MDGLHDIVLALGIHIGSGFVKQVDGRIMQQGAGHGKALALAAGKIAAALMQSGLQAVLAAAEIGQIHLFQCRPELCLVRVRLCHAQVALHRTLEDGGVVGHQRQGAQTLFLLQLLHRHAAQRHAAGIAGAAAGQQRRNGAFAAAALTHQRDKAALRNGKGDIVQDGAVLLVAKGDMLKLQSRILSGHAVTIGRLFRCQKLEDLLCRSGTVHGNVEVAAQQPQRQEKVRRQQHDGQCGGQGQPACRKCSHRADDAKARTAVSHQVHQCHRVQLHGEHLHGDLAEALGLRIHLLVLPAVGLINFQGGQALNVLQKAVAKGGVFAPVVRQQLFGKLLHCHNGHGDQRHAAQQDDGRPCVHTHQQHKQGNGCQQAVKQLRQVFCKVGVDLLHTFAGQHHHLAGGRRLGVVGAKAGKLCVDAAAQGALDILGSLIAHGRCQHGKGKAHGHRGKAEHKVLPQLCTGQAARKGFAHQPGNGPHKDHVAQHPQPLESHIGSHIPQRTAVKGQQFFVDHWAFSVSAFSASLPNRRSYSPVKMRSGSALVMARAAVKRSSSLSGSLTGGKWVRIVFSSRSTCFATQMPRSVI